jgi:hypothetical protein
LQGPKHAFAEVRFLDEQFKNGMTGFGQFRIIGRRSLPLHSN